jgi:glycosyltransferase involved in cell wall biosynthesis
MSRLSDVEEQANTETQVICQGRSPQQLNPVLENGNCPLMLFDLSVRGHHPAYIQHLIRYVIDQPQLGRIVVVVSPRFLEEHCDVVEFAQQNAPTTVQFQAITWAEERALGDRKSARRRFHRLFKEWRLLCKYAEALHAYHCLIMYFDTCLIPIASGVPMPCPVSGIYFRPTFHYPEFANYHSSFKNHLQHWQEKGLLTLAGRRNNLQTLFSLDPFAVSYLNHLLAQAKAIHLPDPIRLDAPKDHRVQELQIELGLDPHRTICLLFGALTGRKGVPQVLDAIAQLSYIDAQKLCLLLVGESSIADDLNRQIAAIIRRLPVQIVSRYEFVPEDDVSAYFHLSDVVLAPYQRHVGMSGILLQAAAAGKPILSSDYGLMGEMVHRYELGLAVDSTQPSAIAQGLKTFLTQAPSSIGNRIQMQAFAEQNSANRFAQTIFQTLLSKKHLS